MNRILSILLLLSLTVTSQVSKNRLKSPSYGWINRVVPTNALLDSTFNSFWMPTGNSVATNTAFIGTTNNKSLTFKANNNQYMKLDSVGGLRLWTDATTWNWPLTLDHNVNTNGYILLRGPNNSAITYSSTLTGKTWWVGNQMDIGDRDSYCISSTSNPSQGFVKISNRGNLIIQTYSNNVLGPKLTIDTLGGAKFKGSELTWSTTATGYTNNVSIRPYATFTDIPAMYMGVSSSDYGASNYILLSDGINNVFNSPRGTFVRSGNVNLMNCNATNTTSGYFIEFNGISQPTVTAQTHGSARFNSNILGFESGSFAQNNNVVIAADSYSSNGATTITDGVGLNVSQPTAGTGMTISRAWAINAVGNVNISSRLKVGNVMTAQDPTTATLVVIGTASVSSTSTLNGLQLASGGYSVTSKVINTSAGDAATINSPVGRFRKDNSGTTFVLTNNQITANSIIVLTLVSTGITTGNQLSVQAGAGTMTVTFETAGVAAAPNANCDVNFMIMN